MPKTNWCIYVPPPNMARDLIDRHMKAKRITSVDLAPKVGLQPQSVRNKKRKGIWTVDEYRDWCTALGITDPEEVGKAVLNRI